MTGERFGRNLELKIETGSPEGIYNCILCQKPMSIKYTSSFPREPRKIHRIHCVTEGWYPRNKSHQGKYLLSVRKDMLRKRGVSLFTCRYLRFDLVYKEPHLLSDLLEVVYAGRLPLENDVEFSSVVSFFTTTTFNTHLLFYFTFG